MKSKKIMLSVIVAASVMSGCTAKEQQEKIAVTSSQVETQTTADSVISITTDQEKSESKIIEPLPASFDMEHLDGNTIHASFKSDDVYLDGGSLVTHLNVYAQELFDMVDISQMEVGDTLRIDGQDMVITSLERDDYGSYIINGGLENDGCYLSANEDGVYFESLFDDAGSYYKVGEVTLPIDQEFTFNDHSDLDNPDKMLYAGDYLEEIPESNRIFTENETTVRIEDGWIKEITVNYTP